MIIFCFVIVFTILDMSINGKIAIELNLFKNTNTPPTQPLSMLEIAITSIKQHKIFKGGENIFLDLCFEKKKENNMATNKYKITGSLTNICPYRKS